MTNRKIIIPFALFSSILAGCGAPAGNSSSMSSISSSTTTAVSSATVSSSSSAAAASSLILQENQTGVCSFSGAVESEHQGFTGAGFINTDNASGVQIRWRVNATAGANYTAIIRYANGGVSRTADLRVNDGANGSSNIAFPTGAWTSWISTNASIYLNQGQNDLALIATSAEGLANIDSLTITGPGATAVNCAVAVSSSSSVTSNSSVPATSSNRGSACKQPAGTVTVTSTIIVNGDFDGGCKEYVASFGDSSQAEGQPPVFRVNGGNLYNVFVGPNGDGIHIYGNANLTNITWRDVAEDALTVKADANVTISNFEAYSAADKVFQLNAKSTFVAKNCIVNDMGKMFRENGGKCYPVNVSVDNCTLNKANDAIFRSDCGSSTWKISNSTVTNADVCYSGTANCDTNPN